MEAEEMFKEIGYEIKRHDNYKIIYKTAEDEDKVKVSKITFDLEKKLVLTSQYKYYEDWKNQNDEAELSMRVLHAIIAQCKELEWFVPEKKPETNFEHYYDEIYTFGLSTFALHHNKIMPCSDIECEKCEFCIWDDAYDCEGEKEYWLKQQYKPANYKLSQFEYDMLSTFSDNKYSTLCIDEIEFLKGMKDKAYFEKIPNDLPICEILNSCEVVKYENC